MVFLKLQREPGVYSRVAVGLIPKACLCSVTSEILYSYEDHRQNLLESWQGNEDSYRDEPGDPGYFYSCQSDIGIPNNFQQESGIITF